MSWIDEFFDAVENDTLVEPNTVTITKAQYDGMIKMIENRIDYRTQNFKEVKFAPQGSVYIGGEFEPYGDRSYYLTPEGEYVCTYYSIGD